MSVFKYHDIQLAYPYHLNFAQEAVYDEEGGVDRILTRFDISIQTLLNIAYLDTIYPDIADAAGNPGTSNVGDIMNTIRSRLLTPRKRLQVLTNGIDLIPPPQILGASTVIGTVDAKNGPQPQHCNITQLTNSTFWLNYRIVAHYVEIPKKDSGGNTLRPFVNNPGNPVLSNRWSETVDLDNCQFSRRTRQGRIFVRSDNIFAASPDALRSAMAVTGVPKGFLRESSSYTISPDGLALQYRITDQEQFKMPPSPAFEAEGTYTESSVSPNGAKRIGQVQLRLKGDKFTPQRDLYQTAVSVAAAKAFLPAATLNGQAYQVALIQSFAIRVNMYQNEVECNIQTWLTPTGAANIGKERTEGLWGLDWKKLAFTPGSDGITGYTPAYRDRGTASLLLQAAAYWNPADTGLQLNRQTDQNNAGLPIGAAGLNLEPNT